MIEYLNKSKRRSSPKRSPNKSKRKSPKKSPNKSKKSPKRSPNKSKRKSPNKSKKSPNKSKRKSPKSSSNKSKRKSPKSSSKKSSMNLYAEEETENNMKESEEKESEEEEEKEKNKKLDNKRRKDGGKVGNDKQDDMKDDMKEKQKEEYDETQIKYIHINFFVDNEKNKILKKKINELLKLSFKVNTDVEFNGYLWLLGIYNQEEVIACVCVGYSDKTIYNLAVNHLYRKYGIAKKILTLMTQRCCIIKDLERPKIQIVKTNELYSNLLVLYQKVGFVKKNDDKIKTTLQYKKNCEIRDLKSRDEYWVNCREINSIIQNNKFCFLCNEYLYKDIPKHVLNVSWLNKGGTNIFMIGEVHAYTDPIKYGSIKPNLDNLFDLNYKEKFREPINFFIEVTDTQISNVSKFYEKADKIIHGPDSSKARKQILSELREDVILLSQLPLNKIRRQYYTNILNPLSSNILNVYSADHDNSFDVAFENFLITFSDRKNLPNIFSKFFNDSIVPLLGEFYIRLKLTDNIFTKYNGLDIIKIIIEDFNNMLHNDLYIFINYISLLNYETEEFIDMITHLTVTIKRLSIDYYSFLKIISTNFSHTADGKNNIIFYGGIAHTQHLIRIFEIFDFKLMRSTLNSYNNYQYENFCFMTTKYRTPFFDEEFRFNSCVSFPKCESSEHSNSTSKKMKEKTPPFIPEDDDNDLYSSDDESSDDLNRKFRELKLTLKRTREEEEENNMEEEEEEEEEEEDLEEKRRRRRRLEFSYKKK